MKHAPGALVTRYAKALFEAAVKAQALPQVRSDLDAISAAWREHPELAMLVVNPGLTREKVQAILMALADRIQAHVLTRNFICLLLDKQRIDILSGVGEHFEKLWRDHEGQIELSVITAVPVSEPLQKTIFEHLAKQSGKQPLITWKQDPDILGGIVVQWPDRIFDGSLARKLDNLKNHLALGV